MAVTVLVTGDIHIGRRPTRLPGYLDGRRYSTAVTWEAIVEYALHQKVDLLLLSGDIVDRRNRFFEAYGPLEEGLRRLAAKGIETVAVTGNHDYDILPRFLEAGAPPRFHLLGQGGCWESWESPAEDQTPIRVDGWSFPQERVDYSPLRDYMPRTDSDRPVIGLLHGDLDRPESPYAPLRISDLQALPVSFWVLGHWHTPRQFETADGPPILYPGSPQGLDPGEPGVHGPWQLVWDDRRRRWQSHQIPLAKVCYDCLEVSLEGIDSVAQAQDTIASNLSRHAETMAQETGSMEHLCCRLRLTGRTAVHRHLQAGLTELQDQLELRGAITATIDAIQNETRPALVLDELARGSDLPALLARTIRELESAPSEWSHATRRLLEDTRDQMVQIFQAPAYREIQSGSEGPDLEEARGWLRREGMRLLDELLAQKESGAADKEGA